LRFLAGIAFSSAAAVLLRTIVAAGWALSSGGFLAAGLLAVCSVLSMVVMESGMLVGVDDEEEELMARDER